jgi:hypothetical protein
MMQEMAIMSLALALSLSVMAAPISHAQEGEPTLIVSGTLVKLNLETLRGLLTTDFGKPVFFEVPKAYLFENVTLGARITLQLDEEGRAVKVMDTALPDLVPTVLPTSRAVDEPAEPGTTGGTMRAGTP